MHAPLWISEAEVVSCLDLDEAIESLERGFALEGRGEALALEKTYRAWPGGGLHALGAAAPSLGLAGTKTWVHTERGAAPLLVLHDAGDGGLRAVVEAFALGQLRTGGVSAVATKRLAAAAADELAILGTGKQALAQVAGVARVRPLRRIRAWSPDPEHRRRFAERVRAEIGVEAVATASVAEAVRDAPIVTLVTRARSPFLDAGPLARGAHLNAVGAISLDRAEVTADVLRRCDRVVVDSLPAARELSSELRGFYESRGWEAVTTLGRLVADGGGRPAGADLTVFKAMGSGVADLALGAAVLERAIRRGLGRELPRGERAAPRLVPGPFKG